VPRAKEAPHNDYAFYFIRRRVMQDTRFIRLEAYASDTRTLHNLSWTSQIVHVDAGSSRMIVNFYRSARILQVQSITINLFVPGVRS